MIITFHDAGKNIPDAGVTAVLYVADYMVKVLAGGHHDGSTAHGYAMENDFRFRVLTDDPLDPLGNIFFIKPAHADVFAFADSVRAVVRQQYMISLLIE